MFVFIPLWISCSEPSANAVNDNGYFRGYRLGMEPDSLLSMEPWTPAISTDTLITFEQSIEISGQPSDIQVYAAFDSFGLFEVQVDCFPNTEAGAEVILNSWREKLTKAFGASEAVLSAERWTTYSLSNNLVEVTLSLEQDKNSRDFVSLNYLEPLDDAY